MKNVTVILNAREYKIELHHSDSDAGIWKVRLWRKTFLWFRKRISSDWFIDGKQALAFAQEMKRKYEGVSQVAQQ
ncbi:MAG: hypothetical protein L0Y80_04810 [Ignavibacteriae bacterium]|nr:hypothetical protein [Ignavibacteriota bacterium]